MLVTLLEVGLVAVLGLALLASSLRATTRTGRPAPGTAGGTGASDTAADGGGSRRRRAGWAGGLLFVAAVANGLAFHAHTSSLGGTADGSQRVEGRYHVSSNGWEYTEGNGPAPVRAGGRYYVSAHRRFTEVTGEQWRAVRAHEVALYATHALLILAGLPLLAYSREWGQGRPHADPASAPDPART